MAEKKAEKFSAEIHLADDLVSAVDDEQAIADAVKGLGYDGAYTVKSDKKHPDGGRRIVVEGK